VLALVQVPARLFLLSLVALFSQCASRCAFMSAIATEDEQTGHAAKRVWEEEDEDDVFGLGRLRPLLPVVPAVLVRPNHASIV
jgi:hypothetical protein